MTQKSLAIQLSYLKTFFQPSASLEQYATDSELAAHLVWFASLQGDIQNKAVADFGCGPGILGFGALLSGAKKVYFVDIDKKALHIAEENLDLLEKTTEKKYTAAFLAQSVELFKHKVDVVIENPPFGVQTEHADKVFLEKAMTVASVIYSIHKITSKSFIAALAKDHGFSVTHVEPVLFALPKTQPFHKKKVHKVPVGIWRLEKI